MTLHTLNLLSLAWIAAGVITLPFLLRITQPYGRHISTKWGPMISNKAGWIIQELPSLIFLTIFFLMGSGPKNNVAWFLWGLWALHYINRSIIFPLRTHTKGKKIPILIVCSAICFNFVNTISSKCVLVVYATIHEAQYAWWRSTSAKIN